MFRGRAEQRSISHQDVWGSGGDVSQFGTGSDGALRLVPVYAAINTIGKTFASTPLAAYRMLPNGSSERLTRQPKLITDPSGLGRSVYMWKSQCITSLLTRGNAYGLVTAYGADGWPSGIEWLNPDDVSVVEYPGKRPEYFWFGRPISFEQMIHIPWVTQPGRWQGLSPLAAFKVTIETGQAAQTQARNFMTSGGVPAGHLKNNSKVLKPAEALDTKKNFKQSIEGRDIFVSGSDWEFKSISISPDEARFIETLRLTATQVANIYGIKPSLIGGDDAAGALHYSTEEQNTLSYMRQTMQPWYVQVEEALSSQMSRPVYAKFDMDSQVRADLNTRMTAFKTAQDAGVYTNDEVRAFEDKPPLTDIERGNWMSAWRNQTQSQPQQRSAQSGEEAA